MTKSVRMDRAGRILLPKPMRERLGFRAGTDLDAEERSEGVFIKAVSGEPTLVLVDGLLVHQGRAAPGADWDRALDGAREERLQQLLKP
ncbi:MAG TPA: AbrB/MazE/SpoVT family DNA-binding domain-containing protein [Terriglobales bacterium]